jgi:proteasome assembly chaperone (PAC2) family protein
MDRLKANHTGEVAALKRERETLNAEFKNQLAEIEQRATAPENALNRIHGQFKAQNPSQTKPKVEDLNWKS